MIASRSRVCASMRSISASTYAISFGEAGESVTLRCCAHTAAPLNMAVGIRPPTEPSGLKLPVCGSRIPPTPRPQTRLRAYMRGNPEPPLRFGVLCLTSSGSIVNERQAWSRLKDAIHQFMIIKLKYSLTRAATQTNGSAALLLRMVLRISRYCR
jgi:hypothetical protein